MGGNSVDLHLHRGSRGGAGGAVVIRLKPRLRIVGKLVPTVRRRDLVAKAARLYPTLSLRKRWVRAREHMPHTGPRVAIGIKRVDTSRSARTLREAGIVALHRDVSLPEFLKRLIKH